MNCPVHLKLSNLAAVVRINENEPGNKTGKFFEKTGDGKKILRDVMAGYIPGDISRAEKKGFSAPDASWFKGESIDFVKNRLLDSNAAIYEFMDKKTVAALIQEHMSGQKNRRLLIWSLLNVETWLGQVGCDL